MIANIIGINSIIFRNYTETDSFYTFDCNKESRTYQFLSTFSNSSLFRYDAHDNGIYITKSVEYKNVHNTTSPFFYYGKYVGKISVWPNGNLKALYGRFGYDVTKVYLSNTGSNLSFLSGDFSSSKYRAIILLFPNPKNIHVSTNIESTNDYAYLYGIHSQIGTAFKNSSTNFNLSNVDWIIFGVKTDNFEIFNISITDSDILQHLDPTISINSWYKTSDLIGPSHFLTSGVVFLYFLAFLVFAAFFAGIILIILCTGCCGWKEPCLRRNEVKESQPSETVIEPVPMYFPSNEDGVPLYEYSCEQQEPTIYMPPLPGYSQSGSSYQNSSQY